MLPITRLACLALFFASVESLGATERSLSDDAEVVMQTEGEGGELFTFKMFGDGIEIVAPDGEKFEINAAGNLTEVILGEDKIDINEDGTVDTTSKDESTPSPTPATPEYMTAAPTSAEVDLSDRRLQTFSCDSGYDSCLFGASTGCGAITTQCTTGVAQLQLLDDNGLLSDIEKGYLAFLKIICQNTSFCSELAVTTGCRDICPISCDPTLNNDDNTNEVCTGPGEICCPFLELCEVPDSTTGACGDPHMTGFLGQKFDFTGEDGEWYCLLEDGPSFHLNMRVSSPVPSLPEITYITGLSVITTDDEGIEHSIVISVANPNSMDSACPVGVSPCLADGALTVELDGVESLASPGEVSLGPGVAISVVNLPGPCRTFGYEKYWERKKLENASAGRRLDAIGFMQDMGDWVLGDPTATNMLECTEYVAAAGTTLGGLFTHESEHASFQIVTPKASIRLSHGRLHQLQMRDPTDQFDLPEHLTWQMNVAIDHHDVSLDATGVLGETVVPTVDDMGKPIMQGIHAIRGSQDEYRVAGPLETDFAQGRHRE